MAEIVAEKAYPRVKGILDYMVELHDDIMKKPPQGFFHQSNK
jgi:hypothetical protein